MEENTVLLNDVEANAFAGSVAGSKTKRGSCRNNFRLTNQEECRGIRRQCSGRDDVNAFPSRKIKPRRSLQCPRISDIRRAVV